MAAFDNGPRPASVASSSASTSAVPVPVAAAAAFRAPAHKNSHHLHSIPPREKSTRTLIVDHMLWVHGRTRLAQARAELGMADLTGGPVSANYAHRTRPENYDDDEEGADEDEDTTERRQDLPLARTLRLRAEGLEKVVTSMLSQPPPPPLPPLYPNAREDDEGSHHHHSATSVSRTNRAGRHHHPHTLPNGVRLRLALGTIVNDFFARQAPHPPYRHTREASSSRSRSHSPDRDLGLLPCVLLPLTPISGAFRVSAEQQQPEGKAEDEYYRPPPASADYSFHPMGGLATTTSFGAPHQDRAYMPPPPVPSRAKKKKAVKPTPSTRTRTLYAAGADPSTANSPPGFRCPRHLYIGCEICVEAKLNASTGRGGGPVAGHYSNGSGDGNSSMAAGSMGLAEGGKLSGWKDGSGIGTGLLKPDVGGSALRRKVGIELLGHDHGKGKGKGKERQTEDARSVGTGAGNTKLGNLIPRFIKLSALVAGELGREARGEEVDGESDSESCGGESSGSEDSGAQGTPTKTTATTTTRSPPKFKRKGTRAHRKMYETALKPTAEWYTLLGGLLTRAVVEGYLTAGWRGAGAVECLSLVGVGVACEKDNMYGLSGADDVDEDEDEQAFEEMEPDEYPSLVEAAKVLFPSLRYSGVAGTSSTLKTGEAEQEYAEEMYDRLKKFYNIPDSTPDLSTHMEDMAWQYPAEPVERAAVRFCEAIAEWRGKPELEMYKKKPQQQQQQSFAEALSNSESQVFGYGHPNGGRVTRQSANRSAVMAYNQEGSQGMMIPLESLVHSNPTSPTSAHRRTPRASSGGLNSSGFGGRRGRGKPSVGLYFSAGGRRASGTSGGGGGAGQAKNGFGGWGQGGGSGGGGGSGNGEVGNAPSSKRNRPDGGELERAFGVKRVRA